MIWNFVIGGVAGWMLATILNEEKVEKADVTPEQALEVLVKNIRDEAQWAMEECTKWGKGSLPGYFLKKCYRIESI